MAQDWESKKLVDGGSCVWVYCQKHVEKLDELRTVPVGVYRLELSAHYLNGKLVNVLTIERRSEGAEFVEKHANAPHVRLVVIGVVLNNLRAEVVGSADDGSSHLAC